jgi:hypothetical protein
MAESVEVPVFGGILQSFKLYFSRSAQIIRNPLRFARSIDFSNKDEIKKAWNYIFASIAIAYIICIPALLIHKNDDISSSIFLIAQFLRMSLMTIIIHYVLVYLGSKRPLKDTFIAYTYIFGFLLPFIIFISMPAIIAMGLPAAFGKIDPDFQLMSYVKPEYVSIVNVSATIFMLVGVISIGIFFACMLRIHKLSTSRTLLGFGISFMIYFPVFQFVFQPMWAQLEGWLNAILKFT